MPATSASLLERLRVSPSADSWQHLVGIYEPLIRGWLRQRVLAEHDVDDVTQEVMAVVVRRLMEFEHNGRVGAFRTWLKTITINCLRDHWKRGKHRPVATGQSSMQDVLAQLEDPESELSRQWDLDHDRIVARRLLEMLRGEFEPRTWQAFQRTALEGASASEVAAELGVSTNAVFIARSRVLARLRQEAAGIID
jgi:RNA polymerase sigma-70 factor (ECF subfamily)